jgi:hypothetical protein
MLHGYGECEPDITRLMQPETEGVRANIYLNFNAVAAPFFSC